MTDVRRIVVINGEDFVGLVTTPTILAVLERTLPALGTFANQLRARGEVLADVDGEMGKVFALWNQQLSPAVEQSVTTVITPDIMRRWFGDAMFQTPLRVTDLSQASIVDLLRILDYPSDTSRWCPDESRPARRNPRH
jgi:hypothetical protein